MGASRKSVDPEVLDALARLEHDGRAGFVARIISLFFDNAQALIGEIKAAAVAHELSKVRRASHKLRASSAAVGGVRLAELCNQLAGMARAGSVPGLAGRIEVMEQEYFQVEAILVERLGQERARDA
jgi:HPt (histidine-containing phosphotransfer) domain-containing protein